VDASIWERISVLLGACVDLAGLYHAIGFGAAGSKVINRTQSYTVFARSCTE
jgi:hypothetical protein